MPLIPGTEDRLVNIRKTATFLKYLVKTARQIEFIPYHFLDESKRKELYGLFGLCTFPQADPTHVEEMKKPYNVYTSRYIRGDKTRVLYYRIRKKIDVIKL